MIDRLPRLDGVSAIVISPGRAQITQRLKDQGYQNITAFYLDLYSAAMATQSLDSSIQVVCAADLPDAEVDLVLLPVLKNSEAELTRDWMQQAHQRLKIGGHLALSVDHPGDQWVHQQMQALFSKVSCDRSSLGCVYWAKKTEPLKKIKSFDAEFVYRCSDSLIKAITRPGVFAHRRIDAGARQLIEAAEIGPKDHVLDIGCGAGSVALAAAHQTSGLVHAVDSNARAVECVRRSAELLGLTNVKTNLNADGQLNLEQPVEIALANPPYYGDDAISQHFVDVGIENLVCGGALLVVTKNPRWYHAYFENKLDDIAIFESGKYFVCCGRKP